MEQNVVLIATPFTAFSLPSLQMANISAYLKSMHIKTKTLFPCYEFADYIGWENYKILREDMKGQKVFSDLLFGTNNFEKDFPEYIDLKNKTESFFQDYELSKLINKSTTVVFYIYNKQLLSSLYFSRLIKSKFKCKVWFAGFHCGDKLGENLKLNFTHIDETFDQNVEENILNGIIKTNKKFSSSLDFLPTPDYDDFYELSQKFNKTIPAFIKNNMNYQVEFTRGCKWNKCTFCTLNCSSPHFRIRSTNKIIKDYYQICSKYNTSYIVPENFVMDDNWEDWILEVSGFYINTIKNLNLNFKVTDLNQEYKFKILQESKANILIGTESFSDIYLNKMNKGHTVIENIQTLKWAKRWNIPCFHNIIHGLPFENPEVYYENKEVIELIYHLQPPFDIEEFRLTYGSDIFRNAKAMGIFNLNIKKEYRDLLPDKFKKKYLPFFYDFELINDQRIERSKWKDLIEKWRNVYYIAENKSIPNQDSLLKICSAQNTFSIVDNRYGSQITYPLTKNEYLIYLFLNQITTREKIYKEFKNISINNIDNILKIFKENKLIFESKGFILALAI